MLVPHVASEKVLPPKCGSRAKRTDERPGEVVTLFVARELVLTQETRGAATAINP